MSDTTSPSYRNRDMTAVDAQVKPRVGFWDVAAEDVMAGSDARLDAGSYDPHMLATFKELAAQCERMVPLGTLAKVSYGQRFERVFTDDPQQGVRYFNPTDLLSLMAFGTPSADRYLSPATNTNIDNLVVRQGWLLLTCSGSVSRVFYVGRRMDGWAATHDIVRIVPHENGLIGYLYAWLATPEAKIHIAGRQHGGVVQHITAEQVAESLVPRLGATTEREINSVVMNALTLRERAIETLYRAWPL